IVYANHTTPSDQFAIACVFPNDLKSHSRSAVFLRKLTFRVQLKTLRSTLDTPMCRANSMHDVPMRHSTFSASLHMRFDTTKNHCCATCKNTCWDKIILRDCRAMCYAITLIT